MSILDSILSFIGLQSNETPSSEESAGSDPSTVEQIGGSFESAINTLFELAVDGIPTDVFNGVGTALLMALGSIYISYQAFRLLLSNAPFPEFLAEVVQTFLLMGLLWYVVVPSYGFVANFIDGFDFAAGMIAANMNMTDMGGGGTKAILTPLQDIIGAVYLMFNDGQELKWGEVSAYLVSSLYKFFIGLFMLVAGIIYVATYMIAILLIQVGAMMAPLLVPFYLISPLSFLATGWLRFMVTAGLQKIIAVTILGATISVISSVAEMVKDGSAGEAGGSTAMYMIAFLITGILAALMLSVPSIAGGLASGMLRGVYQMPSKLTPGGAGASGSRGVSAVGRGAMATPGAAARGTSTAIAAATGARQGASAAKASGGSMWRQTQAGVAGARAGVSAAKINRPDSRPVTANPLHAYRSALKSGGSPKADAPKSEKGKQ